MLLLARMCTVKNGLGKLWEFAGGDLTLHVLSKLCRDFTHKLELGCTAELCPAILFCSFIFILFFSPLLESITKSTNI